MKPTARNSFKKIVTSNAIVTPTDQPEEDNDVDKLVESEIQIALFLGMIESE